MIGRHTAVNRAHEQVVISVIPTEVGIQAFGYLPAQACPREDGEPALHEVHWYVEMLSLQPADPDYPCAARIEGQLQKWARALLRADVC